MKIMKLLSGLSFYSYIAALFVLGLAGVFMPEYELQTLYQLNLKEVNPDSAAVTTFLHQYRFLKVLAVGFGMFAFLFRKEIFTSRTFNYLFLGILFGAATGRVISILIDGRPHWMLISFTVSEFIFGLIILAYSKTTLKRVNEFSPN